MARPRILIPKTTTDLILEGIAPLCLLACILIPLLAYDNLPDQVPSHMNAQGEVDDYAHKSSIIIFPAIGVFLFLLLFYINKIPHHFNYLVKITEENAAFQYANVMRMNRWMNAFIMGFFAWMSYSMVDLAKSGGTSMGSSPVAILLIGLIGIGGYYVKRSMDGE